MTAPRIRWLGDHETKPAPAPLCRIQSLVNTFELPSGPDRLADPADARPWLIDNGLLGVDDELSAADLELLRDVREAFRAQLVHNAGGPPPSAAALAPLRAVAARATAHARVGDDGEILLSVSGNSLPNRLLELLLIARDAQRDGTWPLLKACGNDECLWAFYDRSRNHGGTWCSMATCGNKLKNRQFRARRRTSR
ncbi:CGNR zinc finger domain-containing protein [Mycolicibacterium elephantis]|uniref:CGNR zinc finger domain-containing protein n=1 Tax=Mycolicibacterium elephantis TaxID=81858 RepID=UPI0007E9976E|nr:CGNR zinc finger domain-containing protein [Mycolicibacterium elephantis]OBB19257.1 RNA-binding protein [Mycolicibacterium elephantis]